MQVSSNLLDFTKVAAALSLSVANYKPIPILSTNGTNSSSSHGRVNAVNSSEEWSSKHPEESWGLPSILTIPDSDSQSDSARVAAGEQNSSGQTVGNGCKLLDDYQPKDSIEVEFPSYNHTRASIIRYRKQVGVNGGAWFAQENWMTPSLFDCAKGGKASELDILQGYGTSENGIKSARARLEKHWDTWIQASDFEQMRAMGINTLRLPIGYWNLPGKNFTKNTPFEPYADVYENSWKYIKRAIKYADDNDIGVLIDMHGAYGSQNGEPHSGVADGNVDFFNDYNENKMIQLLEWLMREVQDISNVSGIELLNEPHNNQRLWKWYNKAMDAMRKVSSRADQMPLYFHDAFNPSQGAEFAGKRNDFVVQDTHSYFVYTKQDQDMTAKKHTSQIKGPIEKSMSGMSKTARGNMVVGEWSCALNPNSLRNSNNKRKSTSQFCRAQTDTYLNSTAGVMFWSWNMENCKNNAGWCFKSSYNNYLNKTYNAWGFSGTLSDEMVNEVSKHAMSQELPQKFRTKTKGVNMQAQSCKKPSQSAQGRNAAVKKKNASRKSESSKHSSSSHSKNRSSQSSHSHTKSKRLYQPDESAHKLERRDEDLFGVYGFADGFMTARALAGLMPVSRMGFEEQYLADSGKYYSKTHLVDDGKHNSKAYNSEFKKGLRSVEKEIIKVTQNNS